MATKEEKRWTVALIKVIIWLKLNSFSRIYMFGYPSPLPLSVGGASK